MSSLPPGYDEWRTRAPGDGPDDEPGEPPVDDGDDELVTCMGCGCDDLHACDVDEDGNACHWLRVDEELCVGVCSECPDQVVRFDAGNRSSARPGGAAEESLLLPGDDEFNQTLSYLRDRTPPR